MEEKIPYEERLEGFLIRKRELTEEEANREIKYEHFETYHHEVGEDFTDQHTNVVNGHVFGGWLLGKHPQWKDNILQILNNHPDSQEFFHMYGEELGHENEESWVQFYTDYAEFLNLTGAARRRANQILIQIAEYYAS